MRNQQRFKELEIQLASAFGTLDHEIAEATNTAIAKFIQVQADFATGLMTCYGEALHDVPAVIRAGGSIVGGGTMDKDHSPVGSSRTSITTVHTTTHPTGGASESSYISHINHATEGEEAVPSASLADFLGAKKYEAGATSYTSSTTSTTSVHTTGPFVADASTASGAGASSNGVKEDEPGHNPFDM